MHSDITLSTYSASGGFRVMNTGVTEFVGDPVPLQGAGEALITLAYSVPDDAGVVFSWTVQWSDNLSDWNAVDEVAGITPLVPGVPIATNVYGFIDNLQGIVPGLFARVVGTMTGITDDNIPMCVHWNLAVNGRPIMNIPLFRDTFAFDLRN